MSKSKGTKRERDEHEPAEAEEDMDSFFGEIRKGEEAVKKKQKVVEEVVITKPAVSAPKVSSAIVAVTTVSAPARPKPPPDSKEKGEAKRGGSRFSSSAAVSNAAHHAPLEFDIPSESIMPLGPQASSYNNSNSQQTQGGGGSGDGPREVPLREAAGKKWKDESLLEWPENDFRLFVGNLDKETHLHQLEKAFKHYPSFAKAKLIMSHIPEPNTTTFKCKGYGFVSFLDPMDCAKALRLEQNKYCGLRPMQLKRSKWEDRNKVHQDKEKRKQKARGY